MSDIETTSDARKIVEAQLDAYNNRDIDAFAAVFSDEIRVFKFPNDLSTSGITDFKTGYASYFENTPDLHCKIINRIIKGNKVIDHELVTRNGQTIEAVAIYELEEGKIAKVTFL